MTDIMLHPVHFPQSNSEIAFLNRKYHESIPEYNQLVPFYEAGINEIITRLRTLDRDYGQKDKYSPIHHMQYRIKSLPSILRKLYKMNMDVSVTSAKKNLHDIAGVRVICCYTDDIFTIAEQLRSQDDLQILEVKNYIETPKPNGYRSLHLVVEVPIYMSRGKVFVKVEIQIRTVAMDFWATLEHRIRYKSTGEVPEEISQELKECAELITSTDNRMEQIAKKLRALNDSQQEYAWQSDIERNHS